jgi:hypothetical protein
MFLDGSMRGDPRHRATAVGRNTANRRRRSRHNHGIVREGAPCQSDS